MIRTFKTLLVTLMVAASMAGQSLAQTKAKIDPKAAEILKQVTTYLGTAKTLSFTAITMYDVLEKSGIKTLRVVKQDIVLRRPRGLYSRFKDEAALVINQPQPYAELFIMNADGSNQRPLTDNQYEEGTPAWLPEGLSR